MISNRCYYAMQAVLELARREGQGLATIAQIARSRQIPARFLEAILVQLKQNGYAQSVRGKEGGYMLAKPSREITAGEIVRLFEAPLFSVRNTAGGRRKKNGRKAIFDEIWHEAETAVEKVFDRINFAELAEREKKSESDSAYDFII